ncbi:MAG: hypothetical protein Q4D55_04145 [Eubacteriales bacterium]|nr:hypothetical protein [Eubacteriales bacterium]
MESYLQINYALMCIQPEIAEANGINAETMKEEIIDFYKTMNGKELTAQEAAKIDCRRYHRSSSCSFWSDVSKYIQKSHGFS